MDSGYGVYVSLRSPQGELVASNRETVEELRNDLDSLLGEGAAEEILEKAASRLRGKDVVAPVPGDDGLTDDGQAVVVDAGAGTPPATTTAPTLDDLPAQGFQPCEKCGSLKDKWNPGGFSERTGKNYSGFFGCPNFRNHR